MKAFKKYVIIEKGLWKKAYYLLNNGEMIYCNKYSNSWTDKEIKEDVIKEMEARF